ncbi:sensor histidine kinase [Runella sp.]|uniref:sensor histidine kinase n=1 Tax=Runella sp. TaxID=1960881 RepID=UPI003D0E6001
MKSTRVVILFSLFLVKLAIQAQVPIVLGNTKAFVSTGLRCGILEDKQGRMSFQTIQKTPFVNASSTIPSLGYKKSVIWLKINVINVSNKRWFLEVDNPRLNDITLFIFSGNRLVSTQKLGDNLPFEAYPIPDHNPIFTLPFLHNQPYTLYLRAVSTEDLKFPLLFWEEHQLYAHLAGRNIIWGIYFGFILLITLYNFFLWFMTREAIYGHYCLYVLFFGTFQFSLYGFGYQYIWANAAFNDLSHIFFLGLACIFLASFSLAFLEPYRMFPWLKTFIRIAGYVFGVGFIVGLLWYDYYINVAIIAAGSVMVGVQCYCAIRLALSGSRAAQLYLVASAALSGAILVVGMKNLGWLPAENQDYYLMAGSMLEIVLFSLALGYRLRSMQLEKLRQQQLRDEISTNLHDDLAASLSSLTMFSELNRRKMQKQSPELSETFGRISERSREAMRLVREAVWEINPHNDFSEEWLDRMVTFAQDTFGARQIEFELIIDDTLRDYRFPIDRRRSLFLFFKEAVNNIAKHSKATHARVHFHQKNGVVWLSISDNGHGFDIAQTAEGNGLRNFKKRAEALGAQLKLDSTPEFGTSIELNFRAPTYSN